MDPFEETRFQPEGKVGLLRSRGAFLPAIPIFCLITRSPKQKSPG